MERRAVGHAFDRLYGAALAGEPQHEAGQDGPVVHEYGARPALAKLTAVLGPGETEILAENLEERFVGGKCYFGVLAVDL
jgi:hypothetical protein